MAVLSEIFGAAGAVAYVTGVASGLTVNYAPSIIGYLYKKKELDLEGYWLESITGPSEGKFSICKIYYDSISKCYKVDGFNVLNNGEINLKWKTVASADLRDPYIVAGRVMEKRYLNYIYTSFKDGKEYDNGNAYLYFERATDGRYVPVGGTFIANKIDEDVNKFTIERVNGRFELDDDDSCKAMIDRLISDGRLAL